MTLDLHVRPRRVRVPTKPRKKAVRPKTRPVHLGPETSSTPLPQQGADLCLHSFTDNGFWAGQTDCFQVDALDTLTSSTLPICHSEYRRVWVCEACTFENDEMPHSIHCGRERDYCSACGTQRSRQLRPRLTLAQKRGLVTKPPPRLTRDEWEHCEQQAEARGDVSQPCSICRELLGRKEQVILDCSHMFHQDCLASFERFLRTKQRVCPLCRKQDYQKHATTKASAFHREYSAKRLQAVFRGFLTRRRTAVLWQKFYSAGKGDPARRRRFFASRVGKTADRLVVAMRQRDDSIDALLAEFDKSLSMSRRVFQDHAPETDGDDVASGPPCGDDWLTILRRAQDRGENECAICINSFNASMKDASLLSCSHVFHTRCLRAFEDFNIYEVPLCPVCRVTYRSQPLPIYSHEVPLLVGSSPPAIRDT